MESLTRSSLVGKTISNMIKCIIKDCKERDRIRGLCDNHYRKASKLVKQWDAGVTWATLERDGLALPKGKKYRLPDPYA